MLTRRHVRIKVMQTLYSLSKSEDKTLKVHLDFLKASIKKSYDLYYLLISIFKFVFLKANDNISFNDKINKNFLDSLENAITTNPFFIYLTNNKSIDKYLKNKKINNWINEKKQIDDIYESLNNLLIKYPENDFIKSKDKFCISFYKDIVATSNKLYDYIEDFELTWIDDFPLINTHIVKQIKSFYKVPSIKPNLPFYSLKHDEVSFGVNLVNYILSNTQLLDQEIIGRTPNWEFDRIANLDYVLIKMAIAEFLFFEEIPSKVTINEYLEIAKDYSTPKSNIFINGVLDNISKDLNTKGKLNKKGRGLL